MNPNHYLSVAVAYLFAQRPRWCPDAAVGETLVSSSMIDRVAGRAGRRVVEVPVGFKWFVAGLLDGRELSFVDHQPGEEAPYERLLTTRWPADGALFTQEDAVEAAWAVVDRVLKSHRRGRPPTSRGVGGPRRRTRSSGRPEVGTTPCPTRRPRDATG